jgi:hypothetical protein
MKKAALVFLFLMCLSFAQASDASAVLRQQIDFVLSLLVPLMMAMVVLAAVVYAVGQLFGTETRARASVWAKSMLVAVFIAAVLVALLYAILPGLQQPSEDPLYFERIIKDMSRLAQDALVVLIVVLIVLAALVYALGQMAGAETRARASTWATGMLAGALFATVLYVIFFQILTSFGTAFFSGMSKEYQTYGGVIISVSFFVTAVIIVTYLVSRVFQVPEWEAYLNIELSNLAGSFLLFIFVLGLFGVGTLFSLMIVGKESPAKAAIAFLTDPVAKNVLEGMYDLFRIQTCASMLSVFSRRIGEAVLTNVFKVFPGMDVFVNITNVLGYGLVAIYGSIQAQLTLMHLVDATMVPFFLPAGLILRFFPPTRDAGSFLIAFAFAFQFVFPLIYMINAQVLQDLAIVPYEKQRSEALIQSLCGPFKYGVFGVLFNPAVKWRLLSNFPGVNTLFKTLLSETTLNLISMAEFIPIMRALSVLSLFALFIPAFALVITTAFINAMSKFLTMKM